MENLTNTTEHLEFWEKKDLIRLLYLAKKQKDLGCSGKDELVSVSTEAHTELENLLAPEEHPVSKLLVDRDTMEQIKEECMRCLESGTEVTNLTIWSQIVQSSTVHDFYANYFQHKYKALCEANTDLDLKNKEGFFLHPDAQCDMPESEVTVMNGTIRTFAKVRLLNVLTTNRQRQKIASQTCNTQDHLSLILKAAFEVDTTTVVEQNREKRREPQEKPMAQGMYNYLQIGLDDVLKARNAEKAAKLRQKIERDLTVEEAKLAKSIIQPQRNMTNERRDLKDAVQPDSGRKLYKHGPLEISKESANSLRPRTYVTDEVVNSGLTYMNIRGEMLYRLGYSKFRIQFLSSFLYTKLTFDVGYNYDLVKRFSTRNVGKGKLFDFDLLYIPINMEHFHWASVVVNLEAKELHYLCSLRNEGRDHMCNVLRWLKDEHEQHNYNKFSEEDWTKWKMVESPRNLPKQRNGK